MKVKKEYGSGKEGDVANDLGNREKGDRKREGVKARTSREYSGDVEERGKVVTVDAKRAG